MNKPIPRPLYSCHCCYAEYSWPAEDLHWSEKLQAWICIECWDDESCGEEKGTSLKDEIQRRDRK